MPKETTTSKPRPPLRKGGFAARLLQRKPVCQCWDCLRAQGLTPPRGLAARHTDFTGTQYRTDNGQVDRQAMEAKKVEAKEAELKVDAGMGSRS
jgi:hypothetical protein